MRFTINVYKPDASVDEKISTKTYKMNDFSRVLQRISKIYSETKGVFRIEIICDEKEEFYKRLIYKKQDTIEE